MQIFDKFPNPMLYFLLIFHYYLYLMNKNISTNVYIFLQIFPFFTYCILILHNHGTIDIKKKKIVD